MLLGCGCICVMCYVAVEHQFGLSVSINRIVTRSHALVSGCWVLCVELSSAPTEGWSRLFSHGWSETGARVRAPCEEMQRARAPCALHWTIRSMQISSDVNNIIYITEYLADIIYSFAILVGRYLHICINCAGDVDMMMMCSNCSLLPMSDRHH